MRCQTPHVSGVLKFHTSSHGITLMEILVATFIILIIAAILTLTFVSSSDFYFTELAVSELQRKANRVMNLMVTELRDAKPDEPRKLHFIHDMQGNCKITAALPFDDNADGRKWQLENNAVMDEWSYVVEYAPADTVYSVDAASGQLIKTRHGSTTMVLCDGVDSFTCAAPGGLNPDQYDACDQLTMNVTLSKTTKYKKREVTYSVEDSVWLINARK
ncbi:hypothetical protein ACFL1E_07415 [Candidatus Omnitrophota bacterium]